MLGDFATHHHHTWNAGLGGAIFGAGCQAAHFVKHCFHGGFLDRLLSAGKIKSRNEAKHMPAFGGSRGRAF